MKRLISRQHVINSNKYNCGNCEFRCAIDKVNGRSFCLFFVTELNVNDLVKVERSKQCKMAEIGK